MHKAQGGISDKRRSAAGAIRWRADLITFADVAFRFGPTALILYIFYMCRDVAIAYWLSERVSTSN